MNQTIGDRLKIARKHANIYQEDAARAIGLSRPSLSAIESNKRTVTAEEIKLFSQMYHVSAEELLYGYEIENTNEVFTSQKQRLLTYMSGFSGLNEEHQKQVLETISPVEVST